MSRKADSNSPADERALFYMMIEWTLDFLYPQQSTRILELLKTTRNELPIRVLAMDCEFVRTVKRADSLARLTVKERNTSDCWDILVKQPDGIVDHRTNITGLTNGSFQQRNCCDLKAVRTKFRNLITDRKNFTILVCHDFRRDLEVLGIRDEIPTLGCGLIDTSVIYYYDFNGNQHRKPGLTDLYQMLTNRTFRGPKAVHDSIADCEATLNIFEKAIEFVRRYQQKIPIEPTEEITQKWEPQYIFNVCDVSVRTTEAKLSSEELFGQFGPIKRVKFHYHKNEFTGRCSVFYWSFVELDPYEVVQQLSQCLVDNSYIKVHISHKSKPKQAKSRAMRQQQFLQQHQPWYYNDYDRYSNPYYQHTSQNFHQYKGNYYHHEGFVTY